MSAETLRKAAALMRERAKAATEGPWFAHDGTPYYQPTVLNVSEGPGGMSRIPDGAWIAECGPTSIKGREDSEHIASWHPAVALAVADWLDSPGCACPPCSCCNSVPFCAEDCEPAEAALAVARAYLGESA